MRMLTLSANRLLEIMLPMGMVEIGRLSLQVYWGGLAKVDIGPINVGQ